MNYDEIWVSNNPVCVIFTCDAKIAKSACFSRTVRLHYDLVLQFRVLNNFTDVLVFCNFTLHQNCRCMNFESVNSVIPESAVMIEVYN